MEFEMAQRVRLATSVEADEAPARRILRPRPTTLDDEEDYADAGVNKVTSGSHLLDKVLGGGWARGRIVNVVGDRSSGKTLLAIEASANYAVVAEKEKWIRYAEAESAFDMKYGFSIGMPRGATFVGQQKPDEQIETVEDFHKDLQEYLNEMKKNSSTGLYVLDSLDALSDDEEMKRDLDKGSYGAEKPKKLSKMFRMLTGDIEEADVTLFVISQIRDKLNVTFGETKTRSGGRALDFYCSQILWLAEISKIKRTVLGVERVVGVNVLCKTKKNKVAMPFRECKVQILFNYGIDDENSMLDWLSTEAKVITSAEAKERRAELTLVRKNHDVHNMKRIRKELRGMVDERWDKIEEMLRPAIPKYGKNAL